MSAKESMQVVIQKKINYRKLPWKFDSKKISIQKKVIDVNVINREEDDSIIKNFPG